METREKLMNELNETWEDKLHRTQEVQKERERALEELGITVEKNLVGVHTPKKVNWIFLNLFLFYQSRSLIMVVDAPSCQSGMSFPLVLFY